MYRAKSARSGYSDESRDHEADSLELELQKLQQRFRVSEGERKNLYISREQTKNNQKDLLKSLLTEKENLEKNLNLASSKINQTRDNEYSESIRNGTSKIEQLKKEIENEKQLQAQLSAEARRGEKNTKNIRVQSATLRDKQGASDAKVGKKLNDLEGRLYRANSKYNQQLTANSSLREEIETLRIKHRNFQNKDKKYQKVLKTKKEEINEVIEASQEAHEQREEAKHKTIMLRSRAEKDLQQYDTDIKEEERSAENDFQLKEFMEVKNQEREERKANSNKVGTKRREMEQLISTCEVSWARIREITGEDDLDVMLDQFNEVERENFALFNFINEMNNNIEQKTEDIENIQKQFDRHQDVIQSGEEGQQSILANIRSTIETEKERCVAKEAELEVSNAQYVEITTGLNKMLEQVELEYRIKNNGELMESLGYIEEKINDLIAAKALLMEELDPENVAAIKHILVPDPPAISLTDEDMLLTSAPSFSQFRQKKKNKFSDGCQSAIYEVEMPEASVVNQEETSPLSIEEMRVRVRQKTHVKPDSPKKDIAPSLGRKASTVRIDSTGPSRASRELDDL